MDQVTQETPKRITAIDQLRGYAIFGMLLVNSNGLFGIEYEQFEHHRESFSYADTIAPLFLFVVGMGMRLSWLRRSPKLGAAATRKAMAKRFSTLVLIAFVVYMGWLWDALMDIGLAGLLALWLIDKKPQVRVAAAFILVALYQIIVMFTFYGDWVLRVPDVPGIDTHLIVKLIPYHGEFFDVALNGGPLGPLSWCMMLLFGSLAYDLVATGNHQKLVRGCLGWGLGLCAAGYVLHLPWGGAKAAWPISAYYMTAPFPLWSTGLCFLQLLVFFVLCDKLHLRIPTFTAMGMNPLFIYIIQLLALEVLFGLDTPEMSLGVGIVGFGMFYGIFAGLAWLMHHKKIYVKI
jgi:predicted acyltransferase